MHLHITYSLGLKAEKFHSDLQLLFDMVIDVVNILQNVRTNSLGIYKISVRNVRLFAI
jgi:hypothetical protein